MTNILINTCGKELSLMTNQQPLNQHATKVFIKISPSKRHYQKVPLKKTLSEMPPQKKTLKRLPQKRHYQYILSKKALSKLLPQKINDA